MKKISNYKYNILAILCLTALFIACNDDVEDLGSKVKPVLTADGPTAITVAEGQDAVLSFKLDKAINKPIQYRLVMINDESTATDQLDYVIPGCRSNDPDCVAIEENGGPVGYIFEIPAYTTEYSVNIATIFDDLGEQTETLKLQVISNRTLLGTVDNLFFDITITNSVSNDLHVRLDWGGTFQSGGEEIDNCDLDLDLELYSSDFDLLDFSYTNCPEGLILSTADLADGTYYLYASLWTTAGYLENVNIPANIQFVKPGTAFNQTYDLSGFFPMQDGGLDDGNPNAAVEYTIIKAGSIYTITNSDGDTVFQGKQSNHIKSSRQKSRR
ncbi:hypothetical protein [Flavobacterium sp.]|uniref:hypothetical protein n=1 Tax=Flavobacterium sp. TaxID=239 RepID=UPI00391D9262